MQIRLVSHFLVRFIFAFRDINSLAEIAPVNYEYIGGSQEQTELSLNVLLIPHVVVAVLPQNVLDTRHRVIHYLGNQESVICLFSLSGAPAARVFATFMLA